MVTGMRTVIDRSRFLFSAPGLSDDIRRFVEGGSLAKNTRITRFFQATHQLTVQSLFDRGVLLIVGHVIDLIGVISEHVQFLARAFAKGVIVVPLPFLVVAPLNEPRLSRAGIEVTLGDEGVLLERLEFWRTVLRDVVRVAHRPAIRREVDDVQIVPGAKRTLRIR